MWLDRYCVNLLSSTLSQHIFIDDSKGWGIIETANLLHYKDFILSEKFQDCVYFKSFKLLPVKMYLWSFRCIENTQNVRRFLKHFYTSFTSWENFQVFFRRQQVTTTQVVHHENCQILTNTSHNRNTMHALWLTQFVFVTLKVPACILDRLVHCGEPRLFENWTKVHKSAVDNKWTKLPPCSNLFIFIVRIWAETNQLTNDLHRRNTKYVIILVGWP